MPVIGRTHPRRRQAGGRGRYLGPDAALQQTREYEERQEKPAAPYWTVYTTAAQAFVNGTTDNVLVFANPIVERGGGVQEPIAGVIIVPKAGVYLIGGQTMLDSPADGVRGAIDIQTRAPDGTVTKHLTCANQASAAAKGLALPITLLLPIEEPGTAIYLTVDHDGGSSYSSYASSPNINRFWGQWMRPLGQF